MNEYQILRNSPIVEAVIDIRVKVMEDLQLEQLNELHSTISKEYPEKKERYKWEGKLEFKKGASPISTAAETIDGYMFISSDQKQIFQATLNGFTFSRLKPYETWEHFRGEAHRLWKLYRDAISPDITRVALRYINKMDFPLPIKDFSDYLTAPPIVPEGLPQGVSSFLTRVVIHEPEIDAAAIITQSLEHVVTPNLLPIILDIDVFKQKTEGIKDEEAWEILERFRNFKNEIFFKSITKKAKEVFL